MEHCEQLDFKFDVEAQAVHEPLFELLEEHDHVLSAFSKSFDEHRELYTQTAPVQYQAITAAARTVSPDVILRQPNRRTIHAGMRQPWADSFADFIQHWAAFSGFREAQGIDTQSIFTEIMDTTGKSHVDAVSISTKIFQGVYRELGTAYQAVIPELVTMLSKGQVSYQDLLSLLVSGDFDNPAVKGFAMVLMHDSVIRRPENDMSILGKMAELIRNLPDESFINDFLSDNLSPLNHGREVALLRFVKSFSGITSDNELAKRLMATREDWPDFLVASLRSYVESYKAEVVGRVDYRLRSTQFWSADPTVEQLKEKWLQAVASLPIEGQDRSARAAIIGARRRRRSARPTSTLASGNGNVDGGQVDNGAEQLPADYRIGHLKESEGEYVIDESPDTVQKLVSSYVSENSGTEKLERQLLAVLEYLRTTHAPKGVKKFNNLTVKLRGSERKYPVLSWKHDIQTEVKASPLLRKTRIEFVRTDDGIIAIRKIHRRTDRPSSRRKKA